MLNKIKIKYFKDKLEEEKKSLEEELSDVSKPNLDIPGDWDPVIIDSNEMRADLSEVSDKDEEFSNRYAIEDSLEESYVLVVKSLNKIKEGTFGKCEKCGGIIDEKRLEALPFAQTCIDCN